MAKAPYRPAEPEYSFGLADWLGFVVALVALMIIPGLSDPLTGPKLLVLSVGAFAAIPAIVIRWRVLGRSPGVLLIPAVAAALLLVWAILSTLLSGAPWSVSLYGWWGRGDGLLALAVRASVPGSGRIGRRARSAPIGAGTVSRTAGNRQSSPTVEGW